MVASVGLVVGLATVLCAAAAAFFGATFLAVCFATTEWWTTACTGAGATVLGAADVWLGTDATTLEAAE